MPQEFNNRVKSSLRCHEYFATFQGFKNAFTCIFRPTSRISRNACHRKKSISSGKSISIWSNVFRRRFETFIWNQRWVFGKDSDSESLIVVSSIALYRLYCIILQIFRQLFEWNGQWITILLGKCWTVSFFKKDAF